MRLPYFPGCALKTTATSFETTAVATAKALDVELIELTRWNCCGTVHSLTNDDLMHHIAPVRNLVRAQEMCKQGIVENKYGLVTLCSLCYNVLKRTSILVKNDSEKLRKINAAMDSEKEYLGEMEVIHYLKLMREIGIEEISNRVKKPLKGLKVSPYYGCLLLRPKEISIDNPEHPTIFEELLSALDVDVIENPYKMQCCGSYHTVQRRDLVSELAYKDLTYAAMNGASAIAVSCPLCAFNLDQRQEDVQMIHHDFNKIPIFYISQLMAVAFGLNEQICGFDSNHIDPRPILKERNLI